MESSHHRLLESDEEASEKMKGRVADSMLRIIEGNVIPFMVDKFIDIEKRISNRLKKL
jgi:hypothetical protein